MYPEIFQKWTDRPGRRKPRGGLYYVGEWFLAYAVDFSVRLDALEQTRRYLIHELLQLPTRILLIQDGLYLTLREVDGQEPVLLGYVFGSLLEYQPLKGSRRKAIRVVPDPYPDLDAVLARVM